MPYSVRTPTCTHVGLGSFPFARRYSGNRFFFLFLRLLRCFSSPGSLCMVMYWPYSDRSFSCRVSPFRNHRVAGYLLLAGAYRSLSRLSSALSAKASTLRSYSLNLCAKSSIYHFYTLHSVAGAGLLFGSLIFFISLSLSCSGWFGQSLKLYVLLIISYSYRFDMFSHISSDVLNNFRCFSMCSFQGTVSRYSLYLPATVFKLIAVLV